MSSHQDYSGLAATYDTDRFTGRGGTFLYETDRRIVVQGVAIARARNVLDVPTGTGRVLDYLRDQPVSIVGLDATPEMLTNAKKHLRSAKDQLLLGNAAAMPFADAAFDCVVSLRFFHLFKPHDRPQFAQEFARVLRPGGCLLLSMTNGWYAGGVNWLRKALGRRTVEFEHHGEIRALFPGWEAVRIDGNFLPLQRLLHRIPGVGPGLRWLNGHSPGNRICWERFHLLRKP